ncbi:MAG: methionine--tRNA ligase [Patescibacteria group bacterium]
MITIEDFKKLDIRIGKVLSAEKIPSADKLLKLVFDIGGEQRQIVAGIALVFPDPSVLIGKQVPVLLNLEPRQLRGETSFGMMLCADNDGKPILLSPIEEVPPGIIVK